MPDRPADRDKKPADSYRTEPLGGADAVEKTTYVTGSGTEPETIKQPGASAPVPPGGGKSATWVIIGLLFVAAVLVYLLGFGR